jgi:hypothetical protein
MMNTNNNTTTTFKGRTYKIVASFPVHAVLVADGMVSQQHIEGVKGSTLLLQAFSNGTRRTISLTGRTDYEYPN